jgi:hypothetical protein
VALILFLIFTAVSLLNLGYVFLILTESFRLTVIEYTSELPTKFLFQLCDVQIVAAILDGPISDKYSALGRLQTGFYPQRNREDAVCVEKTCHARTLQQASWVLKLHVLRAPRR